MDSKNTPLLNIKENSWVAKLAAKKLGSKNVAIIIGNTIHLYNVSRYEFLRNENWVKHEICHLGQFRQHGTLIFLMSYVWESILHGYQNNKYEVAARKAELE